MLRVTVLLTLFSVSVSAQDLGPKSEPAAMSLNYNPLVWRGDNAQFAIDTEHRSFCQAQFSEELASKATDSNLVSLARMSAAEHEKLYRKLKAMARELDFKFPPKSAMQDCPEVRKSRVFDQAELDRTYLSYLRETNGTAIREFEAQIARRQSPDNYSLRKLAEKTLPVLQDLQAKVSAVESAPHP
jgi:Domain of unknown function (DUF4142)